MTGHLVPVVKSARRSKNARRARQERNAAAKPETPKPPPLLAGQAQRDLEALEAAEAGHSHPAFQRQREATTQQHLQPKKRKIEATPPPAAVNNATTPASAARRLTSRHMKIGGGVAAGVGAAGAGGYLLNRKVKQRHQELEAAVGKRKRTPAGSLSKALADPDDPFSPTVNQWKPKPRRESPLLPARRKKSTPEPLTPRKIDHLKPGLHVLRRLS